MKVNLRLFLIVVCLFSIVASVGYSTKYWSKPTSDFMAYYAYSHLLIEGKQLADYFEYDSFNRYVASLGFPEMKVKPHNLPTNALGMLPLAFLTPTVANVTWILLSIILYVISIKLLLSIYGLSLSDNIGIGLLAFSFLWRPFYENIVMGQFYIVLLFFYTLSIYALVKKRNAFSALPLLFTLFLKGNGVLALLWFAFTRRWKILLTVVSLLLVVVAVLLPFFSPQTWNAYYQEVVSTLGRTPLDGHVAYQTINAFLLHMFTYDEQWLPSPLIAMPSSIVFVLSLLINLLLTILVFRFTTKKNFGNEALSYSAIVAVGVVTAPISEEHAYVLFLPLIIGLFVHYLKESEMKIQFNWQNITFFASVLLLAIPLKYEQLQFAQVPMVFLAYPLFQV